MRAFTRMHTSAGRARIQSRVWGHGYAHARANVCAVAHGPAKLVAADGDWGWLFGSRKRACPTKNTFGLLLDAPQAPRAPTGVAFSPRVRVFSGRAIFSDGFFVARKMTDLLYRKSSKSPFYGVTVRFRKAIEIYFILLTCHKVIPLCTLSTRRGCGCGCGCGHAHGRGCGCGRGHARECGFGYLFIY